MSRLRQIWRGIHRNALDSWLLIALAVVVAGLSAFGIVESTVVSGVTLALLGVITALLLRTAEGRHVTPESVAKEVVLQLAQTAKRMRFDYPDLQPLIRSATSIDVVAGLSLSTTVGEYMGDLRSAVQRGVRMRLVCPDPKDLAIVELSLRRSVQRTVPSHVTSDVELHLAYASSLRDIGTDVYIGTVNVLPPFGLIRIVADDGTECVFVKFMSFKVGAGQFPVIQLSEDTGDGWRHHFREQIELFMAASTEFNPRAPKPAGAAS